MGSVHFVYCACGQTVGVPATFAGREWRCPHCGKAIPLLSAGGTAARAAPLQAGVAPLPATRTPPAAPAPGEGGGDTLPCPVCGEAIQRSAKKCKHCREWLDPAMRARVAREASPAGRIGISGRDVFFPPGAQAPASPCLICGSEEGVRPWNKTFTYTPPWVWITLLAGVLPAAIVQLVVMKRQSVTLPRCGSCRGRMTLYSLFGWFLGLGGLFAFPFLGAFVGAAVDKRDGSGTGIALGFLVWFLVLVALAIFGQFWGLRCTRIDDTGAWLRFPRPDVTGRILTGI